MLFLQPCSLEGKRPLGLEKLCPRSNHQPWPLSIWVVLPQNIAWGHPLRDKALPLLSAWVTEEAGPCAGMIPWPVETCRSGHAPHPEPFAPLLQAMAPTSCCLWYLHSALGGLSMIGPAAKPVLEVLPGCGRDDPPPCEP